MYTIQDLYDLDHTLAADYLRGFTYPWEALKGIKELILTLGKTLPADEFDQVSENVWIAKDAKIYPNNYIAHDLRYGSTRFSGFYTQEERDAFVSRLGRLDRYDTCDLDQLRDIFLGIYANPVENR